MFVWDYFGRGGRWEGYKNSRLPFPGNVFFLLSLVFVFLLLPLLKWNIESDSFSLREGAGVSPIPCVSTNLSLVQYERHGILWRLSAAHVIHSLFVPPA